jgi:ABC-type multidrug transport system fused ATPase/permease subunit
MPTRTPRQVFELMDRVAAAETASARGEQQGSSALARAEGRVELRDVHFAYPTRPTARILGGVSFVVQPGQVVALVGGSGAGKSTVFHLMENFYRPTQGQVLLDGMSVQSIDHRWLHQAVGLVAQEPVLFRGSIAANIRYSRLEIRTAARLPADSADDDADAAVVEAACMANAHGFISALPCGYRTQVLDRARPPAGRLNACCPEQFHLMERRWFKLM